jgi:hypothetical protein
MIGDAPGFTVDERTYEIEGRPGTLPNFGIEFEFVNFCEAKRPQQLVKNHALIIK